MLHPELRSQLTEFPVGADLIDAPRNSLFINIFPTPWVQESERSSLLALYSDLSDDSVLDGGGNQEGSLDSDPMEGRVERSGPDREYSHNVLMAHAHHLIDGVGNRTPILVAMGVIFLEAIPVGV